MCSRQGAEHGERDPGTDTLHGLQRAEPSTLMFGDKTIEPDLVLAYMGVDGEAHSRADRGQCAECARADRHLVADTADIENDGIGRDCVEPSGEFADHGASFNSATILASNRANVRPCACVMAMGSASAASVLSKLERGRRCVTMARIGSLPA